MKENVVSIDAGSREVAQKALNAIGLVVRGKDDAIRLVVASILAKGHVLLEDVPGVGKTTLARALARVLGCRFSRIQFTADLLPSDVLGVQVLEPQSGALQFRKGPIFANLVLVDEINRASPKTQSALLEAMADDQVTVDDQTWNLAPPFSVVATQNPIEHHGTYPLPESQLDRFMIRLSLGYPPEEDERALLLEHRGTDALLDRVEAVTNPDGVLQMQSAVAEIRLDESVADFLLAITKGTREHDDIELGCSPRGSLAWASLCRAMAFLAGRDFVTPDDVKETAHAALLHRLQIRGAPIGGGARQGAQAIVDDILAKIPVPR